MFASSSSWSITLRLVPLTVIITQIYLYNYYDDYINLFNFPFLRFYCHANENFRSSYASDRSLCDDSHAARRRIATIEEKSSTHQQVDIPSMITSMPLVDKIAQMSQIDVHLLVQTDDTASSSGINLNHENIEYYFGKLGIGSLLITPLSPSPNSYLSSSQYRSLISTIQNTTIVYNRPPVLVGIDSVHGANYIRDAIMTPQQINIASTFNTTNAYLAGYIAAKDTRKAGIQWIFSPILGLGMESLGARIYETFGECPYLVGEMGKAIVNGIQFVEKNVNDANKATVPSRSAACAKHFVGYSAPRTGHDRSPSWIPRRHLYQYFLRPWKQVLQEPDQSQPESESTSTAAMTVMESYTEFDGVPNVANKESLNDILRNHLNFDGLLVTDYEEVENLVNWHKTAKDVTEAVKLTLVDGSVDMSMIPFDYNGWRDNVLRAMAIDPSSIIKEVTSRSGSNSGNDDDNDTKINEFAPYPQYPAKVEMERIDKSVERILNLKKELNMFHETSLLVQQEQEDSNNDMNDKDGGNKKNMNVIVNKKDREDALHMARESIILTKNENSALPIIMNRTSMSTVQHQNENKIKVHVTGPTSNSIRYQSGGWTIQWQGSPDDASFNYGTTVLEAVNKVSEWDVSSSCGVDILGNEGCQTEQDNVEDGNLNNNIHSGGNSNNNMNLHKVSDSDYVIVCIGEEAYTEKPGDIRQLQLPEGQIKFVKNVKSAMRNNKNGKLILVYFGGRPRLLKDMVEASDAILVAFLPGPDGGKAVVDILEGNHNPSAKLPITYPKYADKGGIPYWHAVSDMCTSTGSDANIKTPLPHYQYTKCEVEWGFGHGLSYTHFTRSELKVSDTKLVLSRRQNFKASIEVALKVRNIGDIAGSETVMFFLFAENRHVTPEHKLLLYFEKIELMTGEEKKVVANLSIDDLRFIGPHDDTHLVIQPGMNVKIGVGPDVDCRSEGNSDLCSETISVVVEDNERYTCRQS